MVEALRPIPDALGPAPETRAPALDLPPEVSEAISSITPPQGDRAFIGLHDELRVIAGEFSASHPSRQEVLARRARRLLEKEAALIEERISKMPEGDIRMQWILRLGKVTLAADALANAVPKITRMADAADAQKNPDAKKDAREAIEEERRKTRREDALLRIDKIDQIMRSLAEEQKGLIEFVRKKYSPISHRISTATTVEALPPAD